MQIKSIYIMLLRTHLGKDWLAIFLDTLDWLYKICLRVVFILL